MHPVLSSPLFFHACFSQLRILKSSHLRLTLCLFLFLSPLNCHHLVLCPLSNCPRPLIVLINVVHFTWLRSFPIPRLFFQSHSFVSLWQTDKEELVGEVLHLWPMAATSYEVPWERDTHQNLLWPKTHFMWIQTQIHHHRRRYSELKHKLSSTLSFLFQVNKCHGEANVWIG